MCLGKPTSSLALLAQMTYLLRFFHGQASRGEGSVFDKFKELLNALFCTQPDSTPIFPLDLPVLEYFSQR